MPPSGARRGRRPVSCNLCRERKLRCDRAVPCHNCSARDAECRFSPDPSSRQPPVKKRRETVSTTRRNADSDLAARLNRIEALVVNREAVQPDHAASSSENGQVQLPPKQNTRALHYLTKAVSELDAALRSQNFQVYISRLGLHFWATPSYSWGKQPHIRLANTFFTHRILF